MFVVVEYHVTMRVIRHSASLFQLRTAQAWKCKIILHCYKGLLLWIAYNYSWKLYYHISQSKKEIKTLSWRSLKQNIKTFSLSWTNIILTKTRPKVQCACHLGEMIHCSNINWPETFLSGINNVYRKMIESMLYIMPSVGQATSYRCWTWV